MKARSWRLWSPARRDKAAALKLLKRIMKKYGAPRSIVTDGLRAYSAAMNEIGVAAERHEVGGRLNNRAENSHQPFRRRERAMQRFRSIEDAAEVQLSSCPGAQPIQSGAPSRHEASLQAETLCCLGRVARPRGIDRRSRDGGRAACRQASVRAGCIWLESRRRFPNQWRSDFNLLAFAEASRNAEALFARLA